MRRILRALSALFLFLGVAWAADGHMVLFTEKELNAGDGRVALSNFNGICRATIEYVAEKPMNFVVKPQNNAFMGIWRHGLPAAAEARQVTCDFEILNSLPEMEFRVEGGGMREIRKLTVERISPEEYKSATTIPNPARKRNARHGQIKKAYAGAPAHPVVLFGDSLTDNWRGGRFAYMATNFPVVNAGICGDRIEHLLWRIEDMHDLLTTNPPAVATFWIGTNNFSFDANPNDIARGIAKLVETVRAVCPDTKIIVFAIPPRGFVGRKKALPFPDATNPYIASRVRTLQEAGDDKVFYFDFSALLLAGDAIRPEYYEGDKLHFSDKGYAEVVTPFVAGAIRIVTAKNLPPDYMRKMGQWENYLRERRDMTEWNFALEEMLACETHLADLPAHWMSVFVKLAADPDYTPEMPAEYLRQAKEEGLPPSLRERRMEK